MLKVILTYLVMYGVKSNLVIQNGSSALIFQREKEYTAYRYISTAFLVLGIIICATVSYFLHQFVYSKYNMHYISETVNIVIAGSYNLFVSRFLKKRPSFSNYLYDNSFSYAYDTVFITSVIFMLNMNETIVNYFISLVVAVIVIFITNIIIGFFIKSLNRNYVNVSARNIAVRLFMLAIFAIVVYYAQMLV